MKERESKRESMKRGQPVMGRFSSHHSGILTTRGVSESWYKTPIPEAANLRGENPELCVGRLSSTPGKGGRGGETVIFQPSNKDKVLRQRNTYNGQCALTRLGQGDGWGT